MATMDILLQVNLVLYQQLSADLIIQTIQHKDYQKVILQKEGDSLREQVIVILGIMVVVQMIQDLLLVLVFQLVRLFHLQLE